MGYFGTSANFGKIFGILRFISKVTIFVLQGRSHRNNWHWLWSEQGHIQGVTGCILEEPWSYCKDNTAGMSTPCL